MLESNQWIMVNFRVILDRLRCLQAAILKIVDIRILLRYLHFNCGNVNEALNKCNSLNS